MKRVAPGLVALSLLSFALKAGINFGGRQSALEVSGGTLAVANDNVALSKGTLRVTGASGAINGAGADTLTCTNMVVESKYTTTTKGMRVSGALNWTGDALSLGNNQELFVQGGTVSQAVTVDGATATPSIVQGHGLFDGAITVNDAKGFVMRWQGVMNKNIALHPTSSSTQMTLGDDLVFEKNSGPTNTGSGGTALIDFGGYSMKMGAMTMGSNAQTWSSAQVSFIADTTIATPMTLSSAAGVFEGNDCKLTFSGSGGFLGSVGGTISNAHLAGFSSSVFGGTGTWTLHNVTLSAGSQAVRVVDGSLTGGTADVFAGNTTWAAASQVELLKDLTIGASSTWTLTGAVTLNGNSNSLYITDTSGIINIDNIFTLADISLVNVTAASFDNAAGTSLRCKNVSWHDGAQAGSVCIDVSPYVDSAQYATVTPATSATAGALFGSAVTFANGARISLLQNSTLGSGCAWTMSGKSLIDGNGHTLTFNSGVINYDADLYITNAILGDVASGSFVNDAAQDLYLSNVMWIDDTTEGAILVLGNTEDTTAAPAKVRLASTTSGNLFSTAVQWTSGVSLEVMKGITFNTGAAWTFTKSSVIKGNGNIIDLNAVSGTDPIAVASGQTLTISDAVIVGWGVSDISFAGATLKLVNCAVILDGNVTLGATEPVIIDGKTRFVTGSYTFDGSAANASNYVNGVTLFYDTLGTVQKTNVRLGGSFSGGGIISVAPLPEWEDITFDANACHVLKSLFLSYDIDVGSNGSYEALGKKIILDNSSAFKLKGNGRAWYMSPAPVSASTNATSTKLITVSGSASNKVELHDVVIDGWSQGHVTDSNSLIRYCDGSVLRLQADQVLSTTLSFAYDSADEDITIDLNGYDLDMASDSAALSIANVDATVRIKNGRLINVKDTTGAASKFLAGGATSKWVFQDVDIVLSGNTTIATNDIDFQGNCSISGMASGYTLTLSNPTVSVVSGSRLTVNKDVTLSLSGSAAWAFGSTNATLFLNGATFSAASTPTLQGGALRIDDIVTLSGNMTLGNASNELEIDIMPAASIEITSGTVTYANNS